MTSKQQIRSTKSLKNITRQKKKFPEVLLKLIDISDIVLEVLDARFIEDTRNKEIEDLIKKKKKKLVYVINKSDLSDSKKFGLKPVVFVSAKDRKGSKELRDRIKIESQRVKITDERGYERIQVGIIGYPNVGKSSVINMLKGKSAVGVGSESGFTKGLQKIKLTSEILLLDSPGVIPQKEYSTSDAVKISGHAKVGAKDYSKVKDPELAVFTIMGQFKNVMDDYYGIDSNGNSEVLIEELGKKLNYLKKGGNVDSDRVARKILRDWQEGKIRV